MIEPSASSESGLSVVGQLKVLRSHPVMAGVSEWGQTGEEDPWAKCGQGESKLDLSLIKPRRPETEIEVIRQRNPKEEGVREGTDKHSLFKSR